MLLYCAGCGDEGKEKLLQALVGSIPPSVEINDTHTAGANAEKVLSLPF